jgi:hypothetical protein
MKTVYKKRTGKIRLLAGLLAMILLLPAQLPTERVLAAQTGQPAGGRMAFVTEEVTAVVDTGEKNSLYSVSASLRQYDWDCYSNDYYYARLSAKERQLYERLDAACGELLTTNKDAASYRVGTSGTTRRGTQMLSTTGLTTDQVYTVLYVFTYSNPQYYFVNNIFLFLNGQCALGVYDAFASGGDRTASTARVRQALEQLEAAVTPGTVYATDKQIHDVLCNRLYYLSDPSILENNEDPYYTQSIYGALTTGGTVCAGYTKLYAMLGSYFGLDVITVISEEHAWNEVRYGDHWYLVDVTWDDTGGLYDYFHLTDQQMNVLDTDSYHVPDAFYDTLRPAADTVFASSLTAMQGLDQPQVTLTDTAAGVTITLEAAQGDVYYTLDGSTPDADDRYTEPIALTSSGTYILTALTVKDGMLSSAYDITPIRIAGGSVSVSSAVNASGKKIKVKLKSTKAYSGYEISYASKKDFKNQKTAKLTGTSATITGLKKGTTYYIRVRGYKQDAYGNYYYTRYSKTKAVKIKK